MAMLIVTNPVVMTQVLAHPRAGRAAVALLRPPRAQACRAPARTAIADSSAIAAEVLNAIPVVQSYLQEAREAERFADVDRARLRHRACGARGCARSWSPSSSARPSAPCSGACTRARRRSLRGDISAGHLGQTVVYVIILVEQRRGAVRGLRRPAARRRRDRAADGAAGSCSSPIVSPPAPRAAADARGGASVRFDDVTFRYPSRPQHPTLAHFDLARRARRDGRAGRPERRRQEHGVPAAAALLRRRVGRGRASTASASTASPLDALRGRIGIVPQDSVIFSTDAMENIRYGRPEASDDEVDRRGARRVRARLHQRAARGLPHLPRRARRAPLGRPAPAHLDRARDAEERAAAAARRGDERARRRGRAHGAGRARVGDARPHDDRHRAPPRRPCSAPTASSSWRPARSSRPARTPSWSPPAACTRGWRRCSSIAEVAGCDVGHRPTASHRVRRADMTRPRDAFRHSAVAARRLSARRHDMTTRIACCCVDGSGRGALLLAGCET